MYIICRHAIIKKERGQDTDTAEERGEDDTWRDQHPSKARNTKTPHKPQTEHRQPGGATQRAAGKGKNSRGKADGKTAPNPTPQPNHQQRRRQTRPTDQPEAEGEAGETTHSHRTTFTFTHLGAHYLISFVQINVVRAVIDRAKARVQARILGATTHPASQMHQPRASDGRESELRIALHGCKQLLWRRRTTQINKGGFHKNKKTDSRNQRREKVCAILVRF